MDHGANTLSTTAEKIVETARLGNKLGKVTVINTDGSITIYVGGAGVTSANGIAIVAGAERTFDVSAGDDLYAIAASGTPAIRVFAAGPINVL